MQPMTREPIETDHGVEIPDRIAYTIPMDDPLRHRLSTDEEFAWMFLLEEEFQN